MSKYDTNNSRSIRAEVAFFFYFVMMVGLLTSRTLLTISMLGISLVSVIDVYIRPFRIGLKQGWWQKLATLPRSVSFMSLIGIFILVAMSYLNSSSTYYYWTAIRIKIPFLVLPLAFFQLPQLSQRELHHLLFIFLLLTLLATVGTAINYLSDYDAITESIRKGKPIPTPIHHIRFSLLTAIAVIAGIWLLLTRYQWRLGWTRWMIAAITVWIFIFQHILSVRTGLLVMYAAIFWIFLHSLWQSKQRRRWLLLIIPVFVLMPWLAYQTVPSLKNKVDYLRYDLEMFQRGNLEGFSDGQRLISWQMGAAIFKKNPVFGVGFGDLRPMLEQNYAKAYPNLTYKLPHNQFLLFAAAMGSLGLLAFCVLYFLPLVMYLVMYRKRTLMPLMVALYIIITLSFLFENTLSTAFGTGIYLFFLMILLKVEDYQATNTS